MNQQLTAMIEDIKIVAQELFEYGRKDMNRPDMSYSKCLQTAAIVVTAERQLRTQTKEVEKEDI